MATEKKALAPKAQTQALLDQFKAERQAITDAAAPLRAKRDALMASIRPTEAQIYDLTQQIKAVEGDKLYDLDMGISALARSLGAKVLRAEGVAQG